MADHALDNEMVDPRTFGKENRLHEIYSELRREDPVHWTEPDEYRPSGP